MSQVSRTFEQKNSWTNPEIVNPTSRSTRKWWQIDPLSFYSGPIQMDPYWSGRVDMTRQAYTGQPDKNERVQRYATPRGPINVVTPPQPPQGFMPTTGQLNFPTPGQDSYKARLPLKRTRYY